MPFLIKVLKYLEQFSIERIIIINKLIFKNKKKKYR